MCRTIINDGDNLIVFNFSREKLFKKVFFCVFSKNILVVEFLVIVNYQNNVRAISIIMWRICDVGCGQHRQQWLAEIRDLSQVHGGGLYRRVTSRCVCMSPVPWLRAIQPLRLGWSPLWILAIRVSWMQVVWSPAGPVMVFAWIYGRWMQRRIIAASD